VKQLERKFCFTNFNPLALARVYFFNSPKQPALQLGSISSTCLQTPFSCKDPKSAKRHSICKCLFALLCSAHGKSTHKMLVKSTPEVRQFFYRIALISPISGPKYTHNFILFNTSFPFHRETNMKSYV